MIGTRARPSATHGFLVVTTITVLLALTPACAPADSVEQHQQASEAAISRGDLDAAEAEARLSLQEAERRFGPDDPRTGVSLMWLAAMQSAKGQAKEALQSGERALGICERTFGPDHVETAAAMSMVASLYLATGDLSKAEPLLRRSVAIKEKAFGADHPDTAVASSYLADILTEKGEYAEAARLYTRSLAAVEKAWPPTDASVPTGNRLVTPAMMEGLAKVYVEQGRFKDAEDLLTRAARQRVSLVGSEHLSMAGNWQILGAAYGKQGRGADSEKAYREALRIVETATGAENAVVSALLAAVADSCVMQGKLDVAADLYSRSVTMDEHIRAPGPMRVEHLQGYASVLKAMGRADDAAQAEKRAQEVR